MPLRAHSFEVDARGVGVSGELHVDIVHEKRSLVCSVEKLQENKYQVTFMPRQNGKHRVYIYFNGYDVKGSPYIMRVGSKGRSGKTRSSPIHDSRMRSESPSFHFNTSSLNRKNETVRRERYSPQTIQTSKEIYSTRVTSPVRETPSPREVHNSSYRTEYKNISSDNDHSFKKSTELLATDLKTPPKDDGFNYVKTVRTENHVTKTIRQHRDSESPSLLRASPGLKSPQTVSSTIYESNSRNATASPKFYTSTTRYIPSPVDRRISSPINMHEKNETYKVTERESSYKSTISRDVVRDSPSVEMYKSSPSAVDYSSNIKVTSSNGPSRRDSRDVINKTKHMFSHNSLESLANLTEKQLNTDLSYDRTVDHQTEKNTYFNKFSLGENNSRGDRKIIEDEGLYRPGGYLKNYKTEKNERYEKYTTVNSGFEPIGRDITGARAIRVQDIPDGVLGRPVEFESKME